MRVVLLAVVGCALAAGCGLQPVKPSYARSCSLFTHEPCLDLIQPRANCVPCPSAERPQQPVATPGS